MTEARSRIDGVRSSVAAVQSSLEEVRASTAAATAEAEVFSQTLGTISQVAMVVTTVIRGIVRVVKILIKILKAVLTVIKAVVTQIGRLAVSVGNVLMRPFARLAEQIKKSIEGVKQFFNSIARIAMYRLIRGAIAALTQGLQEGMENLYQYSKIVGTDFANAMDRMVTNALYVKTHWRLWYHRSLKHWLRLWIF